MPTKQQTDYIATLDAALTCLEVAQGHLSKTKLVYMTSEVTRIRNLVEGHRARMEAALNTGGKSAVVLSSNR